MVIVMDMSTGHRLDDFGAYEDEVLGANWLPHPEVQLQLERVVAPSPTHSAPPITDVEDFLRTVYLSQE